MSGDRRQASRVVEAKQGLKIKALRASYYLIRLLAVANHTRFCTTDSIFVFALVIVFVVA